MPLNQKGSRVFGAAGSGYDELAVKKAVGKKKPKSPKEKLARKKAMQKRDDHKVTSRAGSKLRSPRV